LRNLLHAVLSGKNQEQKTCTELFKKALPSLVLSIDMHASRF